MSGYVAVPDAAWEFIEPLVVARYAGKPWPRPLVEFDLRVLVHRRADGLLSAADFPSVRALASRWRWDKDAVAAIVADVNAWQWHEERMSLEELRGMRGGVRPDNGAVADDHPGPLSHRDVVDRAVRWLRGHHGCAVVLAEMYRAGTVLIPDAIGWRHGGWSVLVEAKVSRSDFRADRDKPIHRNPDDHPGQERWYLTPPNLVRPDEVPPGWGLAEVGKRSVRVVVDTVEATLRHDRARSELPYLVAAVRRHQIGVEWRDEVARFVTLAERAAK